MNKDIPSKYKIAALISKSVMKTLNEEEKVILDHWLKNGHNKKAYDRILDKDEINSKQEFYSSLDRDKAFLKLQSKIKRHEAGTFRKKLYRLSKYAAILLVAVSGVMVWNHYSSEKERVITEQVLTEIQPGYEKATLVLSDGTEVDLTRVKNQPVRTTGGIQIVNSQNVLAYNVDKAANEEEPRYNTLHVPVGGIYTVILPDGSKVWLNSASSIRYPERFTGKQRLVELKGEAYFEVKKGIREFVVRTVNEDITVLGTSFNISAYPNDEYVATTLVEGKVKLTTDAKQDVFLSPGEMGYLNVGAKEGVKVYDVDIRYHTSWKDGRFYFERGSLESILKKVGRWYGFKVRFEDEELRKVPFTGVAKKDAPLEDLLEMISRTARIEYTAQKTKTGVYEIIISKK